jgi:hypothetical protein
VQARGLGLPNKGWGLRDICNLPRRATRAILAELSVLIILLVFKLAPWPKHGFFVLYGVADCVVGQSGLPGPLKVQGSYTWCLNGCYVTWHSVRCTRICAQPSHMHRVFTTHSFSEQCRQPHRRPLNTVDAFTVNNGANLPAGVLHGGCRVMVQVLDGVITLLVGRVSGCSRTKLSTAEL